jgi:hypothetical protein
MTQPPAFLNDEEMHWLNDLGLPNQRRWLNHRNIGDEHRRTFPSAATDISTGRHKEGTEVTKRVVGQLNSTTVTPKALANCSPGLEQPWVPENKKDQG